MKQVFDGLIWWPELGYGFFPARPEGKYDLDYWRNYMRYKETPVGDNLIERRIAFVGRRCNEDLVVDIGIGCGHFIEVRGPSRTYGYDVNPIAIRWLLDKGIWFDPYAEDPKNATFWDSLEHMARPEDLVKRVKEFLFVSIPIFHGPEHVLKSKHFKKDEHFWYFTETGFVGWMNRLGFNLVDSNRMEEECGREDIGTYAFKKVKPTEDMPS